MLGTHPKTFPDVVHLRTDIIAIYVGSSIRRLEQAC